MRTKTLICAAALAAGALTSWAQSNVYSLNVVGYVNTVLPGNSAITMIGNPLNNANNNITNLFTEPAIGDGAVIQRWVAAAADTDPNQYTYDGGLHKWFDSFSSAAGFNLDPGEAIFISNGKGVDTTNTFVGDVLQGALSIPITGNSAPDHISSKVPVSGNFTNIIVQMPLADGDNIQIFDPSTIDYSPHQATYDAGSQTWQPALDAALINLNIGQGFQWTRGDPATTWTRNFTVQ